MRAQFLYRLWRKGTLIKCKIQRYLHWCWQKEKSNDWSAFSSSLDCAEQVLWNGIEMTRRKGFRCMKKPGQLVAELCFIVYWCHKEMERGEQVKNKEEAYKNAVSLVTSTLVLFPVYFAAILWYDDSEKPVYCCALEQRAMAKRKERAYIKGSFTTAIVLECIGIALLCISFLSTKTS